MDSGTQAGALYVHRGTKLEPPSPPGALLTMGLPRERALCALRLTVGRPTTEAEVNRAAELIEQAAREIRIAADRSGTPVRRGKSHPNDPRR